MTGLAERVRRVVRESGISGGGSRLLRNALDVTAQRVQLWAARLEAPAHHAIRLSQASARLAAPNASLHGRESGKRCFLLGTGPSLAQVDLELLSNDVVIAVNEACLALPATRTRPSYGVLIDPAYFDGGEQKAQLLRDLAARSRENGMRLVLDSGAYEAVSRDSAFTGIEVFYVQQRGRLRAFSEAGRLPTVDFTQGVPGCMTVSHCAIMLAVYLGCSAIYLLGHDYDFLADPRSSIRRFYEKNAYFQSDASMISARRDVVDLYDWFTGCIVGHKILDDLGERSGQPIYNATPDSLLEPYRRVSLVAALNQS